MRAIGCLGVAMVAAMAAPAAAELPVDLELVLAVDVSGSMDREEQALQRRGYVEAFLHPEVAQAVRSGPYGRIAVTYVEWAGPTAQAVAVPWTLIEDAATAEDFAAGLAEAPPSRFRGTSISGALAFAAPMFEGNGYEGLRRVIDVSGDGPEQYRPAGRAGPRRRAGGGHRHQRPAAAARCAAHGPSAAWNSPPTTATA